MTLVFIHGKAASGKLTVARELGRITGLPVFHNHLAVDAALSVFEFGSEPFVRVRHQMWMTMFREAIGQDRSLTFTFAPEPTVPASFVSELADLVVASGGRMVFVRLECSVEEQERRIDNPSRNEFQKLTSKAVLREIREQEKGNAATLPADLTLDTETMTPAEAAERIKTHFGL